MNKRTRKSRFAASKKRHRGKHKPKREGPLKPAQRPSCGDCRACCVVMGVTEINKDPYKACPQLFNRFAGPICREGLRGCRIYKTRPKMCAAFECGYRIGLLDGADARPDKLGVLITPVDNTLFGPVIMAYEVWPEAFDEEVPKSLINTLKIGSVVMLGRHDNGKRSIVGPSADMQRIAETIQSIHRQLPEGVEITITGIDLPDLSAIGDAAERGAE